VAENERHTVLVQQRHELVATKARVPHLERMPQALVNMALALRWLDRPADALLVLGEAEAVKPGMAATELARGIALVHTARFAQAREAFDEYRARLKPGARPSVDYFYFAALNLAAMDQLNEAEALVAQGLDTYAEAAPLLLLLGVISERRGDLDNADRSYRQALDEDASLAQAHKNLGDVAYRRASHDEALQHYMRAAELDPRLGDDVFARIGNLHYKARDFEAAVQYWQRALLLNPDNAIVRNNLDIVAHAAG
jgi:tetratricopeptide (TPR) repeat protein